MRSLWQGRGVFPVDKETLPTQKLRGISVIYALNFDKRKLPINPRALYFALFIGLALFRYT